jgi:hypothetical protein
VALALATKYESPTQLLGQCPMERFLRSLKGEWIPDVGYRSFEEAERMITQYIVGYYSRFN